jgi:membrane protease YdiL (CAAX protease family)
MDETPSPEFPLAIPPDLPAPGPPWNFLDLAFTLLIVLGTLFVAEAAMAAAVAMHMRAVGDAGRVADKLPDVRYQLPVQFVSYALTVWSVMLTARIKYRRSFAEALEWRTLGPMTWQFIPAGVALALVSQLVPLLFPSNKHFPIEQMLKDPVSGWSMAFFGVCIAPFVEEMFFRGMIYPVFEKHWGMEAAVLGSAALFASIHAFLVGVALGYARARTRSIVPSFLMHIAYNVTLFVAIIVGTKGFHDFSQ